MPSLQRNIRSTAVALTALLVMGPVPMAHADFDGPPKPRVDCSKPENKSKPQCQRRYGDMTDDEIYNAAYWLARQGEYREALEVLAAAHDPNDKRILNATGYATRKLGNVDAAIPFYMRALSVDPAYSLARSYLGEAYLVKGDLAAANGQLAEIAARCGTTCDGFGQLSDRIESFEAARQPG